MICLGIDPDTKNTGIALVRATDPTKASKAKFEVLQVGVAAVDNKLPVGWRILKMTDEISFELWMMSSDTMVFHRVAVEGQTAYAGSKQHKRPDDLIGLAQVAGMAAGISTEVSKSADLWIPKPAEWKGQVEKKAMQRRILKRVGLTEKLEGVTGAAGMTKVQRGHVIDAIGLALWVATIPTKSKIWIIT